MFDCSGCKPGWLNHWIGIVWAVSFTSQCWCVSYETNLYVKWM
jgi:hypothetical protein